MEKSVFSLNSFWLAVRYFLFLNAEQTKILLYRKMEGSKPAHDWVSTLDNLTKFDEQADNARRTCNVLGWWTVVLGVVVYIGNMIAYSNFSGSYVDSGLIVVAYYLYMLLFFASFVCWLFYFLLKRVDLENRLRFFVYPLLKILVEESKEGSSVILSCQMGVPKSKRYKTGEKKNYTTSKFRRVVNYIMLGLLGLGGLMALVYHFAPHSMMLLDLSFIIDKYIGFFVVAGFVMFFVWLFSSFGGKYPKITNTFYTYPWFSFTAKMEDDTVLSSDFVDTLLSRRVVKSNPRGKIKTKYKNALKRLTSVTIGFDKDNYTYNSSAPVKGSSIQVKPNEKRHAFKIKDKQKFAAENTNTKPSLDKYLGLIARAYEKVKQVA